MADWKYGDVLANNTLGARLTIMFVGRWRPFEEDASGRVVFWGFSGVTLDDTYGRVGMHMHFGGHPAARHNNWDLDA